MSIFLENLQGGDKTGKGFEDGEIKIVYLEGEDVRAIRGKIVGDDGFFIKVSRESGAVSISKRRIVKIEEV